MMHNFLNILKTFTETEKVRKYIFIQIKTGTDFIKKDQYTFSREGCFICFHAMIKTSVFIC